MEMELKAHASNRRRIQTDLGVLHEVDPYRAGYGQLRLPELAPLRQHWTWVGLTPRASIKRWGDG